MPDHENISRLLRLNRLVVNEIMVVVLCSWKLSIIQYPPIMVVHSSLKIIPTIWRDVFTARDYLLRWIANLRTSAFPLKVFNRIIKTVIYWRPSKLRIGPPWTFINYSFLIANNLRFAIVLRTHLSCFGMISNLRISHLGLIILVVRRVNIA